MPAVLQSSHVVEFSPFLRLLMCGKILCFDKYKCFSLETGRERTAGLVKPVLGRRGGECDVSRAEVGFCCCAGWPCWFKRPGSALSFVQGLCLVSVAV